MEQLNWKTIDEDRDSPCRWYTDRADVEDGYLLRTWQYFHNSDFAEWRIFAEHHVKSPAPAESGKGEA